MNSTSNNTNHWFYNAVLVYWSSSLQRPHWQHVQYHPWIPQLLLNIIGNTCDFLLKEHILLFLGKSNSNPPPSPKVCPNNKIKDTTIYCHKYYIFGLEKRSFALTNTTSLFKIMDLQIFRGGRSKKGKCSF